MNTAIDMLISTRKEVYKLTSDINIKHYVALSYPMGSEERRHCMEKVYRMMNERNNVEYKYSLLCAEEVYKALHSISILELNGKIIHDNTKNNIFSTKCWYIPIKHNKYSFIYLPYNSEQFRDIINIVAYAFPKKDDISIKIYTVDDIYNIMKLI